MLEWSVLPDTSSYWAMWVFLVLEGQLARSLWTFSVQVPWEYLFRFPDNGSGALMVSGWRRYRPVSRTILPWSLCKIVSMIASSCLAETGVAIHIAVTPPSIVHKKEPSHDLTGWMMSWGVAIDATGPGSSIVWTHFSFGHVYMHPLAYDLAQKMGEDVFYVDFGYRKRRWTWGK